ncbi:MAG: magnesium-transporting ATPase [Pseudanabaena frigida]|uniref:Magnesium-transporting ATPase n=1 Tax=Pseudanabaena frigida TaxID=945775 RepID=A0A2W4Y6Y6_9CYAN|nr:MAG: magnesium-transporting ATPase [Pseudanabaena frigida]
MEIETKDPATVHWHTLDADGSIKLLQSDADQGITNQEVSVRFNRYGANELVEKAGRSSLQIFIDQFTNIMLLMLMAVAIVSAVLDIRTGDFPKDAIAISSIVILNGILGYMQESNAEKALAALKRLSSPKVRVVRNGETIEINGKELVPGDIMLLEAGVQIAADGRLLEEQNLQVRESALTGEAEAVNKEAKLILAVDASLGDRLNCVYQGTEVVQGRAKVLVTKTGMQTELGKIAALIQDVETEDTPLQQRMTQLGNVLVSGSLALVGLVVLIGMFNKGNFGELLKTSLSMAVAVVPEGLPAVVTVTLALGTQRMVRRNALIRRLPAVETLGSVTTICSDKTGTLTQNKMVVQGIRTGQHSLKVSGDGYNPFGEFSFSNNSQEDTTKDSTFTVSNIPEVQQLLMACVFCNDAILQQKDGEWIIIGDPTEGALIVLASKGGCDFSEWQHRMPRVSEVPFSSERKRMSVLVQGEHGGNVLFCKGSPELTLECCTHIQIGDRIHAISDSQRQQVIDENNDLASRGLRVLGFAYRTFSYLPEEGITERDESNLVWVGLVGMLDAPRPEVREAVILCREAGIRPVMITGDHQLTAKAIAIDLGIARTGDRVLTGRELEQMSSDDLDREVDLVNVYARVSPEHKLRIVQALQRQHHFVAMTGDGVNDAPALKQADIGIAMGITGTDVSKEASDMILLDDNFATIVAATEEGRVVYTNIRRFIKYILGSNIGEVITIAVAPMLNFAVPLIPLQILWMNLVTDGLPALALAVEPAEPNVMKRPPVDPRENIFARGMGAYMVRIGIILSIITVSLMVWAHGYTNANFNEIYTANRWETMVFTTLCLAQMGHAIAIRSNTQLTIELDPRTNLYVWGSVILTTVLQMALIYVEPLRRFFGTHLLTPTELAICFGFSALMFVWIELEKLVIRWWLWQRQS